MLGIRRHGAVAIDLFQGDPSLFASDVLVSGARDIESLAQGRHVAVTGVADPAELSKLKSVLDSGKAPTVLRRVTFILASLDLYYAFQDELFKVFPETGEV